MKIDSDALQIALQPYGITALSHAGTRPFTDCFIGEHAGAGSRVFVKALHSEDPGIRRNFLRELDILKALNGQPGFPVLVAACPDPPVVFHACGYLSTPTFEKAFASPDSPALPAILQSASALALWIDGLHRRGFAHRDLSPDHVFMTGESAVCVVDFGMAKRTADLSREEAQLCEGYDIQAFGMILWELVCGRSVFSYRSNSLPAQISGEIELIRSVELYSELVQLITRCLSARSEFIPDGVKSNDPFESAKELHAALSALLRNS